MIRRAFLGGAALLAIAAAMPGQVLADASDGQIAAVIDEGLNRSEAMVMAGQLMDGIGPRLTNSQNYRRASDWATQRMTAMGLQNVRREQSDFGLGWNVESFRAAMVTPRRIELTVMPVAWSPPTEGTLRAPVVVAPTSKPEHFAAWKGKLAGKLVMISPPGTSGEPTRPAFRRLDDKAIAEHDDYDLPHHDPGAADIRLQRSNFPLELSRFLKAYFNLDNGGGKIRGIYAEGNLAAEGTLGKWLKPFAAMGAGKVVTGKTGGTDHVFLQAIGLPGYQFIQDPLDYDSRVHHTSIDTLDRLRGDDLRQAATVMAAMLLQAANSDRDLPRMPLPSKPVPTDPFKIRDPDE